LRPTTGLSPRAHYKLSIYQGRNVTDIWVEEAGLYETPDPIDEHRGHRAEDQRLDGPDAPYVPYAEGH
jgi:hypothetical protein